jgi:hypothetical protein
VWMIERRFVGGTWRVVRLWSALKSSWVKSGGGIGPLAWRWLRSCSRLRDLLHYGENIDKNFTTMMHQQTCTKEKVHSINFVLYGFRPPHNPNSYMQVSSLRSLTKESTAGYTWNFISFWPRQTYSSATPPSSP